MNGKPHVLMYAKAGCPYCMRAEQLLREKGVDDFEKIRTDLEPARREEMIARSGRSTVPQIFIGDVHVGGCDDLHEMERQGRLNELLQGGP